MEDEESHVRRREEGVEIRIPREVGLLVAEGEEVVEDARHHNQAQDAEAERLPHGPLAPVADHLRLATTADDEMRIAGTGSCHLASLPLLPFALAFAFVLCQRKPQWRRADGAWRWA